jgi:hypothetical protein
MYKLLLFIGLFISFQPSSAWLKADDRLLVHNFISKFDQSGREMNADDADGFINFPIYVFGDRVSKSDFFGKTNYRENLLSNDIIKNLIKVPADEIEYYHNKNELIDLYRDCSGVSESESIFSFPVENKKVGAALHFIFSLGKDGYRLSCISQ